MSSRRTWAIVVLAAVSAGRAGGEPARLNVLLIAIDDLRPSLGCYGDPQARTPHIDRLAQRGVVFERAYCQFAVCNPSRASMFTGRRPDRIRVHDLETHFRKTMPDVVTLPEHFKAHGYHTQAFGKIFHAAYPSAQGRELDDARSWSAPWWGPRPDTYHTPAGIAIARQWFARHAAKTGGVADWRDAIVRGLAWEAPEVADDQLSDGQTAARAVAALGQLQDRPFFLAVGFVRPHLPLVAPRRYFDLHPLDQVRVVEERRPPRGSPPCAAPHYSELSAYHNMPRSEADLTDQQARALTRAYHACVSYVDAMVGRLIAELERQGLADRTVVVLLSDHGFHLGHNGMWGKGVNWEQSLRVPLIVAVPGQPPARTAALVELVDIYPSLAELCGLPPPRGADGTSFVPLLRNAKLPGKPHAFSQVLRYLPGKGKNRPSVMGYSVRTERYRFNSWSAPKHGLQEFELYDHQADPGETRNLARQPEHAGTVEALKKIVRP